MASRGSRGLVLLAAFAFGASAMLAAPVPEAAAHSTEIQYLSGHGTDDAVPWDFFCTAGRNSGFWSKIPVPSCWEQEGFGQYQYGLQARGKKAQPPASEQGRYRDQFQIPASWSGRTVRLVFAGAMTDTEAWINGQSVGPVHQGAFYQFKYDVSRLLKYGASNLLEVTVAKESANASVNAAERRGDYWNFGGIFRPVYLEALPAQYIDRVAIAAKADGSFTADVYVGGTEPRDGAIVAQIVDAAGLVVGEGIQSEIVDGRATVRTKIASPRRWTAESPNLYRARFILRLGGSVRHVVTQRFGFRTFEVRPRDGLYLNGEKIAMKGVDRHSFWPETGRALCRDRNYADARLIKEMNMNAVRMSHYPPDQDFLEACDELGIYVLDELSGWHGIYDTPTGQRLVGEMVRRDVNHPSILFWDNGNETGWNTALDGEFDQWDPQQRPVLHPQAKFSDVETMHYRSYPETQAYLARGDIFMPTEFLHGLYDGGHGAGLWDYWELMRRAPNSAGGFLWSFADEGIARTDEGGRIDNVGNYAPDGILGPHHEREGSFDTIREVWSPVVITGPAELSDNFNGHFDVENRYDFTPLDSCTFRWTLAKFAVPAADNAGHAVIDTGRVHGPAVKPHRAGTLQIALPTGWRDADVLYVTALNPAGAELWTWSWPIRRTPIPLASSIAGASAHVTSHETATAIVVDAGDLEVRFSRQTGELIGAAAGGQAISLVHGPRLIAARRGDRLADGTVEPKVEKGVDRRYDDVSGTSTLTKLAAQADGADMVVEADYDGNLKHVRWRISPNGDVRLDYDYSFDGVVDLIGVKFDYPETAMRSIRWLGYGPYRVWQNRTHGTTLDVWQNAYNDAQPGQRFTYPEFKGFFRGWRWADFTTSEGHLVVGNESSTTYLGVYTPKDGADGLLYTFPATGLSILDVIPPVRNKVNATELIGPQSQPQRIRGMKHGSVRFRFEPNR